MAETSKLHRYGHPGANLSADREIKSEAPSICVLDDDPSVREALSSLLSSAGLRVTAFASATEFLTAKAPESPACLVLDLQLPDISGLDVQRALLESDGPPIVFISGHADIPSSVRAMKAGAIEFLPKPFSDQELLAAIDSAIAQERKARQRKVELVELRKSYARLSAREREVLPLIVAGLTNKHTAAKLGIAEITVQVHRAQIVRKLAARSVPDLVRMASKLGIS
jgi:FixJ family two-component response regulator